MTIVIKGIMVLFFISIFFALGSALYFLVKGDQSEKIVEALTWRIGLSLLLFVLLFFCFAMGWIAPHPL